MSEATRMVRQRVHLLIKSPPLCKICRSKAISQPLLFDAFAQQFRGKSRIAWRKSSRIAKYLCEIAGRTIPSWKQLWRCSIPMHPTENRSIISPAYSFFRKSANWIVPCKYELSCSQQTPGRIGPCQVRKHRLCAKRCALFRAVCVLLPWRSWFKRW